MEGSPFGLINDQSSSLTKGQQEALATQATSRATKGQQEALAPVATSAGVVQFRTSLSKEHIVLTLVLFITSAIIGLFGILFKFSLRGSSRKQYRVATVHRYHGQASTWNKVQIPEEETMWLVISQPAPFPRECGKALF